MHYKPLTILLIILISFDLSAEERSAEAIYSKHCKMCHETGLANAPKTHDKAAWDARGKKVEELVASSLNGLNAMPPKGACADCTETELKAAIEFMMSSNK